MDQNRTDADVLDGDQPVLQDQEIVQVTDLARERILGVLRASDPPLEHLRVEVRVTGGRFEYKMSGLPMEEVRPDDAVLNQGELCLVLDPDSVENLRGASIDFRESLLESGFQIDNPNEPTSPGFESGLRDDLEGTVPERVQLLLDREINPTIAAHGGIVNLADYKDGTVYLSFGGGCHGCGMVDVTLKEGIETRIREAIPEVVEVMDTTDHSAGENPFY